VIRGCDFNYSDGVNYSDFGYSNDSDYNDFKLRITKTSDLQRGGIERRTQNMATIIL
jgi:hypothetical protein